MKIAWGAPTRHPDTSHLGARVFVEHRHGGWSAHHHIDTHGMTSAEVAMTLGVFEMRHRKWVEVQNRVIALQGTTVGEHVVVDCTIPPRHDDRGYTLIIGIRKLDGSKVSGWPIRINLASIDTCPANDQILSMVVDKLGAAGVVAAAHEEFAGKVARLLPKNVAS